MSFCPYCGLAHRESETVAEKKPGKSAPQRVVVPPPLPSRKREASATASSPVETSNKHANDVSNLGGATPPAPTNVASPAEKKAELPPPWVSDAPQVAPPSPSVNEAPHEIPLTEKRQHYDENQRASSNKGNGLKYVVGILLLAGAGAYIATRPSAQDVACKSMLTDANSQFTAGNIAGARGIAGQAASTCSGDIRSRAVDLQAALDRAANDKSACDRNIRTISSQVADRRITSARNSLDQLETHCSESSSAKDLRQKVVESQAISAAIQTEVRNQIAQGDAKAAKSSFDQLAAQNRENPDLAGLRAEIAAIAKAAEAPTPPPALPQATQQAPGNSSFQGQADLVQAFLRDAEQSLSQQKFDAAKTFVESARRIDPMNSQAAALWRRIKDRELQYLKDETTIK